MIAHFPAEPQTPLSLVEWRDVVCRTYVRVSCTAGVGLDFAGWIRARTFGIATLSDVGSTPMDYVRSPQDVRAAPSEDVQLLLMHEGHAIVGQDGRQCRLEAGDMVLYDATRPFELHFPERYNAVTLKAPRSQLLKRLSRVDELTARVLRRHSRLSSLATSMIRECARLPDNASAHAMRLSDSLLDVVAVAFESEFAGLPSATSRRQRLLRDVQQTMCDRLADPDLDLDAVCQRHCIAPRTLNRLFAEEGTTAMRWLWQQRLEASRRALADGQARNVTEAALGAGFTNLSHFSRSFRRAFGVAPSALQSSAA